MNRTLLASVSGLVALFAAAVHAQESAPAAVFARPERITTEDFGALPFLRGPGLSPDGTQVLARGYTKGQETGVVIQLGEKSKMGRAMQDDLDDGVKWLVEQGKVDPKRVSIMGSSYGGYAAMWAAARNTGIYRGRRARFRECREQRRLSESRRGVSRQIQPRGLRISSERST